MPMTRQDFGEKSAPHESEPFVTTASATGIISETLPGANLRFPPSRSEDEGLAAPQQSTARSLDQRRGR